jgi:hypothetical protein
MSQNGWFIPKIERLSTVIGQFSTVTCTKYWLENSVAPHIWDRMKAGRMRLSTKEAIYPQLFSTFPQVTSRK